MKALLWLIPLAILTSTACGGFFGDNCDGLTPVEIISGSYVTRTASPDPSLALHDTGTDKHMLVDREGGEVTISYADVDGREIVETWSMGEITVE